MSMEDKSFIVKLFAFMFVVGLIFAGAFLYFNEKQSIVYIGNDKNPTLIDGHTEKVISKVYNSSSRTLTIKNETDTFADITLLTPLNNYVQAGTDIQVAEIEFDIYKNVTNFLGALETFNVKKRMENISRAVTFKYAKDVSRIVTDYAKSCNTVTEANGTYQNCSLVVNGTKSIIVRNWTVINWNANVRAGTYIVGIFANVSAQEKVEWIPNIAGLRVSEWASWDSSLSNGLFAYYNFTDYNNSLNSAQYPLILSGGTPTLVTGKTGLGTAINCSAGAVKQDASYTKFNMNETTTFTVNYWGLAYSGSGEKYGISKDDAGAANWYIGYETGVLPRTWGYSTVQFRWTTLNATWNMFTVSCNATACVYYENGVRGLTGTKTQQKNSSTTILAICDYPSYSARWSGLLDEIAFWNVSLSDASVSTLWASGYGMSYSALSGGDTIYPQFTNNVTNPQSPVTYVQGASYQLNMTVTNTNGTVFLEFGGANYSTTNASNVFTKTFTDLKAGNYSYKWIAYGNGSSTNLNVSLSDYFNITKANVSLSMTYSPSDNVTVGTATTVTGVGCVSAIYCNLTRNGTEVTNPNVATLGVGLWYYNYSTAGNENYSGSQAGVHIVNVSSAPAVSLVVNLTYPYNQTSTVSDALYEFTNNATSGSAGLGSGQSLGFNITLGKNTINTGNFVPSFIEIYYNNTASGTFTLTIYNVTSTGAFGTALYKNTTTNANFVTGSARWYNLTLINQTANSPSLVSGTEYKVVLTHTNANGGRLPFTQAGYKGGAVQVASGSDFIGYASTSADNGMFQIFGSASSNTGSQMKLNTSKIYFNSTITYSNLNLTNYTVYIWNASNVIVWNYTNSSLARNLLVINTTDNMTLIDGNYTWNILVSANNTLGSSSAVLSALNGSFAIDTAIPIIQGMNSSNVYGLIMPNNLTVTATISDANIDTCYYTTSDDSTPRAFTCNVAQNISFTVAGTKNITFWANDTFGNLNSTNVSAELHFMNVTRTVSSNPASEGQSSTYTLTLNQTPFNIGDAEAYLNWNNTNFTYDAKTNIDGSTIQFSKTFTIPTGTGSSGGNAINYYWIWNATNYSNTQTSTQTQTILSVSFTNCSATSTQILQLNLKDELSNSLINISNITNIQAYVLLTSISNASQIFEYNTTITNNNIVRVCIPNGVLNVSNYTIDFTIGFSAGSHVAEFYYLDNGTLTSNTTAFNSMTLSNISLMDLLSIDSTTFLFHFTDESGLAVPNGIVHVFRDYIGDGVFREVERGRMDNNGQTHLHLTEEDVIYYFVVSNEGNILYTSDQYNAKCLSTPCTIELSASGVVNDFPTNYDAFSGMHFSSNRTSREVILTYSLPSSSTINMTLYQDTGNFAVPINSSISSGTSGTISVVIPLTYGNSTYFVSIYKNGEFIGIRWIDFKPSAQDYFGIVGAILGGLIILAIFMITLGEGGVISILGVILGIITVGALMVVEFSWIAFISIICAGGVIIWAIIRRKHG